MRLSSVILMAARWLALGVALGLASWAGYAAIAWTRYGQVERPTRPDQMDPLLDRFMPTYEAVERNSARVAAPTEITFAAATTLDLQQSTFIGVIFRSRELILGSEHQENVRPQPLLAWAKAIGWGVLAEVQGREVVVGAVTRPWEANVVFRALRSDEFAAFYEPDYVKIAWTLRADPVTASESVARTETRVTTTSPAARAKFRRYWAAFSPGIVLIRQIAVRMVKQEAEHRARPSARMDPSLRWSGADEATYNGLFAVLGQTTPCSCFVTGASPL